MDNPVKDEVVSFDKKGLKPTETKERIHKPTKEEIEREKKEAADATKK